MININLGPDVIQLLLEVLTSWPVTIGVILSAGYIVFAFSCAFRRALRTRPEKKTLLSDSKILGPAILGIVVFSLIVVNRAAMLFARY